MSNRTKTIDLSALSEILKRQGIAEIQEIDTSGKVSILSLGNPLLSEKPPFEPPRKNTAKILKDGLNFPFVKLSFYTTMDNIESNNIIGFKIYKKRIMDLAMTDVKTIDQIENALASKAKSYSKFSEDRKEFYRASKGAIDANLMEGNIVKDTNYSQAIVSNVNTLPLVINVNEALGNATTYGQMSRMTYYSNSTIEDLGQLKEIAFINYKNYISQKRKLFEDGIIIEDNRDVIYTNPETGEVVRTGGTQNTSRRYSSGGTSAISTSTVDAFFEYNDRNVFYGEMFDYYVSSIAADGRESDKSKISSIFIYEFGMAPTIQQFLLKQNNNTQVAIILSFEKSDYTKKVAIYRRSADETDYKFLSTISLNSNTLTFFNNVICGKTYFYRVFPENIFGGIGQPAESELKIASVETGKVLSDAIAAPSVSALQYQNAYPFVKINIYPGDPRISFYEIVRQKYVGSILRPDGNVISVASKDEKITITDYEAYEGFAYRYIVYGYDNCRNKSNPGVVTVPKIKPGNLLKAPYNLRYSIWRNYPLRIKIMFDYDQKEISGDKVYFEIQRREYYGQSSYFCGGPTYDLSNGYCIMDEEKTLDFIPVSYNSVYYMSNMNGRQYQSVAYVQPGAVTTQVSSNLSISPAYLASATINRTANFPFLTKNKIYFYRIRAKTFNNLYSDYSDELMVEAITRITPILSPSFTILNESCSPCLVKLNWFTSSVFTQPDYVLIERKLNIDGEKYSIIGKQYLLKEFYDAGVELGKTYVYRLRCVGVNKKESSPTEIIVKVPN